jgi:L-threonylcarbamoyladenylate synthase
MDKDLVINTIKNGGIGVLPTDTIYGIAASALLPAAVERVYQARGRRPDKPCIILIADTKDLTLFGVDPISQFREIVKWEEVEKACWPGPVSIVFACPDEKFSYLHRGTHTLAFRLPKNDELRTLLRETGPLIAPSANPEGQKPAALVSKAREYFGDNADFYVDGGIRSGEPSTVLQIKDGKLTVLRQGVASVPKELL